MKKRTIISLAVLLGALGTAAAAEYHYGFILSCGHVEYYTSDQELSEEELLKKHKEYEAKFCKNDLNTDIPDFSKP